MKLYSTHCPKCKVIETKIKQKNLECEIIDNTDDVVAFGIAHSIANAPILELDDGTVLEFAAANKYLNEVA